jgi:phage shock protein A
MGILDRVSMIVRSNVNSMLDKSSNPEADLNYFMLEMQDGMKQTEKAVQEAVVQKKVYEMQAADQRRRATEWDAKAQTAVRANRDDLATEALRQKLQAEEDAERLEQQAKDQDNNVSQMRSQLDELRKKYAETEQNKGNLIARYNMNKQAERVMGVKDPGTGLPQSDYTRMQQKIMAEQVRAEMDEQSYRGAAAEAEINKLQAEETLEDELASLKQRMGQKPKTDTTQAKPPAGDDKPYDEK